MSQDTQRRIRPILQTLDDLDAARRLFAELNYDVTRQRLPRHGWPDRPAGALAADPEIIATHDRFQIIYGRLAEDRLLITPERTVMALFRDRRHILT